MAEVLYSLSKPDGEVLWESSDPGPVKPDITGNDVIDAVDPLYFSAKDMLLGAGLTAAGIRSRALQVASERPQTQIVSHPTVLEDLATANEETSLWYLPSEILEISKLRDMYGGPMLRMARLRKPETEVLPMTDGQDPFCFFVTEVKPNGSRMDIHKDGRRPVIVINLSEPEHRGKSLIGHPDLLKEKSITMDMLLNDDRTLVQNLFPECGVVFDVSEVPHVGLSNPGNDGYRVILDADYQTVGKTVDLSVYSSYEQ